MHSLWFATIKRYYDQGIYSEANLVIFVTAKMITQEEMDEILGLVTEEGILVPTV